VHTHDSADKCVPFSHIGKDVSTASSFRHPLKNVLRRFTTTSAAPSGTRHHPQMDVFFHSLCAMIGCAAAEKQ